jgi:hypothetical protein
MKTMKDYIVQAKFTWGWEQSGNYDVTGTYTKAGAKRRAKREMKLHSGWKYRAKKVKVKK